MQTSELSEQETKELEAYGDGYAAGVQSVLIDLKAAWQNCQPGTRLDEIERIIMGYGVDLDEDTE